MEINASNLRLLQTAVDLAFQKGMSDEYSRNSLDLLQPFYRLYPGTRKIAEFPFNEFFPGFREWVGDRVIQNLKTKMFQVVARDFEDSASIPMAALEDDDYGIYVEMLSTMGAMWPVLLSEILVEVITSNKICFTTKPFFATNHKYGKNTISNKVTTALSETTFEAGMAAPSGWKFANGKPVRTVFSHLVVGPKLEVTAKSIVAALRESNGAAVTNPNANRVEVVVLPDLAGDYEDDWFLMDGRSPIKPLGLRTPKTPAPKLPTDYYHIEKDGAAVALADGRAEAFPSFPHLVYGGRVSEA